MRYDADLIGPKPTTDLTINAHAHAPGGRLVREVAVGLSIGALQKTLLVHGPCRYVYGMTGLRVSAPEPFVTQAIRYEYAFGGSDTRGEDPKRHRHDPRNPVGTGVAQHSADLDGRLAPSIYYLRGDPAKVGPAGFGAIACHWSPRRELAGTHDQRWFETKRPLRPDDYDPAHSLCSPIDQRVPRLHGGEHIALVNLSPIEVLTLELPRCKFVATTRIARRSVEHGLDLASVIIEPADQRLIMVWQGSLPVRAPEIDDLIDSRVREVRT